MRKLETRAERKARPADAKKIRVEVELELIYEEGAKSGALAMTIGDTLVEFRDPNKNLVGSTEGCMGGGTVVGFPAAKEGDIGDTFRLSATELFLAVMEGRAKMKRAAVAEAKRGRGRTS